MIGAKLAAPPADYALEGKRRPAGDYRQHLATLFHRSTFTLQP
jgi:hypothetical protein